MVLREPVTDIATGYNRGGLPDIVARHNKTYNAWWPKSKPDFTIQSSNRKIEEVTDTLATILEHMDPVVNYDTDSRTGRIRRSVINAGEGSVFCQVFYIPPQVNGKVRPAYIHAEIKFMTDTPDMRQDYCSVLQHLRTSLPDMPDNPF